LWKVASRFSLIRPVCARVALQLFQVILQLAEVRPLPPPFDGYQFKRGARQRCKSNLAP